MKTAAVIGRRNAPLDLLRAVAALLVIGAHFASAPATGHAVVDFIGTQWKHVGWVGVDIFFVLSGFLVSGLLFREHRERGDVGLVRFLVRRGLKIYPSFWAVLAATLVINQGVHGLPLRLRPLLGDLTFTQNYIGGHWIHFWSLAVEEHFYIALCLFIALLRRLRGGLGAGAFACVPWIYALTAVVCLAWRTVRAYVFPELDVGFLVTTHTRVDSLAFGVLIAWLWNYRGLEERLRAHRGLRGAAVALGAALVGIVFLGHPEAPWLASFGRTLIAFGSGLLLVGCLTSRRLSGPLATRLSRIGAYSYSIYLWHVPFRFWVMYPLAGRFPALAGWLVFEPLYFVGAVTWGIAMARAVEYPVLMLRDRFWPAGNRALPA